MKNKILFASFLPLILLLYACTAQPTPNAAETPARARTPWPTRAATDALFQIVKPDGTKFAVTLDAIKALPLAQVSADDKVEEGPYLRDILALAGITEFTEVTLTGSSNPATLTFAQVDQNTILDFNNHGTMKLVTTYIRKANWTKDVAEIIVK
ncbi:MAG: hypothetical protein K8S20_07070 [Chloroflexi bacterium]|nr:hypothetical protein [Chloroflexota bacterium]